VANFAKCEISRVLQHSQQVLRKVALRQRCYGLEILLQRKHFGWYSLDTHRLHGGAMKDAGMRIRVEPELRESFVNICREKDVPAAQVLRSFMRDYIKANSQQQSHRQENSLIGSRRKVKA
jgi:hypothetical protein